MKRLLTTVFAGCLLARVATQATPTQTYLNPAGALVSTQFTIDAVNFINLGSFQLSLYPYTPFETFDTLNYTNAGIMACIPGWRFDLNSTVTGLRSWSANFVNANPGQVTGLDFDNQAQSFLNNGCVVARVDPSYLLVTATNIVGRAGATSSGASLNVGPNGEIRLTGHNVDLQRSGLQVLPVWVESLQLLTGNIFVGMGPNSFIPDIAVFDQEWASGSYNIQYPLNSQPLWDGVNASAQAIPMNRGANPAAFPGFTFPVFAPSTADSFVRSLGAIVTITNFIVVTNTYVDVTNGCSTNVVGVLPISIPVTIRSNVVKGAVFVGVPPNFDVPQIRFLTTPPANNPAQGFPNYQESSVLISVGISNAVTGLIEPAYIRLDDTLANTPTLRGVIPNDVGCPANTSRPVNYSVDRQPTFPVGSVPGNNGYPDPDFLISSSSQLLDLVNIISDTVTNFSINTGDYSAYGSFFDNIVSRPVAVPAGVLTNTPGRVVITADTLDLTRTRFRGEGGVTINTPHLISSTETLVDVENISYNLGSTNGSLRVQNLVPASGFVERLRGPISVWSTIWGNVAVVTLGNNYVFTNVPVVSPCSTNGTIIGTNTLVLYQTNVTATVQVFYQVLMIDATALTTQVPVNVYDLTTHSPNTVVNDHMTVLQSLLIDGTSFTLNGGINIPGAFPINPVTLTAPAAIPLFDWKAVNAPSLLYFTNHGALTVFNEAHFGDDRSSPYTVFRNTGVLGAASVGIRSFNFENSGSITSLFGMTFQGGSGKLEGGSSLSGGETVLSSQSLKLNNYQLIANAGLTFSVSNSLSDAGSGSANVLRSQNGFNLLVKPQTGDLLGTTLQSMAPSVPSVQINHTWAALDRGPTPAGYTDDAAIGTLVLTSQSPDPFFFFRGTGAHNAMYVDLLDLSSASLTDYTNQIGINNNLVIYYAAAKLGFTPPNNTNGLPQSPEEFLDGQFGGHLRWASSFAGPNSSVTTVVNGQSVQVNKALFNSHIIDSDHDGLPNFIDADANGPFDGAALTVNVVGNGTVNPNTSGQLLLVGETYTLNAQPGDGSVFAGWTGSAVSASPSLPFVMTNGLSFTASFAFVLSPGSYSGLFYEDLPTGIEFQRSGAITVTTAQGGKCSGTVEIAKNRYSFSGQLDVNGAATILISKAGLTLQLLVGNDHVTGTIGDGVTWTASVLANRAVFNSKSNPAPQAGTYTMLIPGTGDPSNTQLPQGDSYFTVTVDPAGKISIKGTLADGTAVTESTTVAGDGQAPIYIPLYSGTGQILGWVVFADTGGQDFGGQLNWIKQPNVKAKFYPDGFNIETNAAGSKYDSAVSPVTGFSVGQMVLSGGNQPEDLFNLISIGADNKVTNLGTNKLTMTISTKQGSFKGSAPGFAGKSIKFNGVIYQKLNTASGFFLGTNQSGKIVISP